MTGYPPSDRLDCQTCDNKMDFILIEISLKGGQKEANWYPFCTECIFNFMSEIIDDMTIKMEELTGNKILRIWRIWDEFNEKMGWGGLAICYRHEWIFKQNPEEQEGFVHVLTYAQTPVEELINAKNK